jgi:hypothetical protein
LKGLSLGFKKLITEGVKITMLDKTGFDANYVWWREVVSVNMCPENLFSATPMFGFESLQLTLIVSNFESDLRLESTKI